MQNYSIVFFWILLAFVSQIVHAQEKMSDADARSLTNGVDGIGQVGVPGPLCVFGRNAAVVIAGKEGSTLAPLLAAAKFGKGRVLAFGHGGYLSENMYTATDGTKRLAANMFRWLGKENNSARIAVVRNPKFADFIGTLGYEVQKLDGMTDPKASGKFQILVVDAAHFPNDQVERISKFVSNGGGLLTASLGWGWLQVSGKSNLKTEHDGNLLLGPMGIVWADGYLGTTTEINGTKMFAVSPDSPPRLLNVTEALTAVDAQEKGTKKLKTEEIAQAVSTIELGIRCIPNAQASVFGPLKKHLDMEIVPTSTNKIRKDSMIAEVIAISLQTEKYLKKQRTEGLPKEGVPAFAAAVDFPGDVSKDTKTVSITIEIDTKIPDWHSTGLYAAPGSIVTVLLPKEAVAAKGKTLGVRIGCHRDGLWGKPDWSRYPEITIEVPCRNTETKIASPFGGPVYLTVPRDYNKGTIYVQIDGCVESPLYVYGKTSLDDWKNTIRNAPGPWGELASDRVILTLPSTQLRNLDDPNIVMAFWNKVLDDDAELCGRPIERDRPERITCDRQISAGYMHSGYPVMTHMDVEKEFVDLYKHPVKGWGFFHEFGHNHQSGDWTFDGTGEVTVNLFTLYNMEQFGLKREETRKEQTPDWMEKTRAKHFAEGSPYDKWKSDPFLALVMYTDIVGEFGWDAFKAVFREYRDLKKEERPRNDDEKRDQWMVRMSRQVGKNLGPYFDRWGVPVSQTAKDSIKDLPEWMPY